MTEPLPPDVLTARLDAARARERAARAEQARLRRELVAADRRLETQRLCVLGRAWLALGERSEPFRERGSAFLQTYVTRPVDQAALAGTPWELRPATPAAEPTEHE